MIGRTPAERARRVQRKRTAGWRMPQDAIYVGRPTKWGNPWRVGALPAAEAVARYRAHVLADPVVLAAIRRELAGRDLVCWCRPDQPCHADVLIEIANTP